MALVKCPECGTEVSSLAAACPKCAFPIASGDSGEASGPEVQTIEQTSKRWKLMRIIASLIVSVSILFAIAAYVQAKPEMGFYSLFGLLFGLVFYLIVSVLAWWYHG